MIQLSILDYYRRKSHQRLFTWLVYIMMGLCLSLWIAGFFASAFLCNPPKKLWDLNAPGHCGDRKMLRIGINVAEIILCILLLALSLPAWKVSFSKPRKFALAGIQSLGLG